MPDTGEALKIWQALRPMVDREIAEQTESCVRAKKMIVKQATVQNEDGSVSLGVAEPYNDKVMIPSGDELSNVNPGSPVWVYWYFNNASTMHVALNGDGTQGSAVTDRLLELLNKEIADREKADQDLYDHFTDEDNKLYAYIDKTASHLRIEFDDGLNSLRSYVELTSSNLRLEFTDEINSLRSYVEITASHLRTEFYDDINSLRSYVEITASHLRTEFYDDLNSLRSYVEITASHLRTEFYDDLNSLRSYVEITASHLRTEFYDDMNSLRSYVEITASHLRTEFYDDLNSLRSYVEITASHLRTEFYDDINSLRSYVEITASHLRTEFYDDVNSLRSYVEITASHLRTEFYDDINSLRSYVEITASHLRTEFYDDMNSLRSYVEITASHLRTEFYDDVSSLRSYVEITASHLRTEFYDDMNSLRSYVEITAEHLQAEFYDDLNSMRSYVELTASHLQIQFTDDINSLRSYVELTAEHLQIEFTDDINSLRSYVELTASHLEVQFTDEINSMRSYVELTASHLTVQFENEVESLRSYVELTASHLSAEFYDDVNSLRSYVEVQAGKIDMNVAKTDENASILRQAGMYINDHGVLIYATDNQNNIGSKLNVLSNEISAKVGKSEVVITDNSVTIGSQSISFVGYVTAENIGTYFLAGDDATFGYLEASTLDVDTINVQGSISTDYINGHDPDAAIATLGPATSSGGQITIPYTTLGGTSGSVNFNIADTQFYKDGVAAAAAGVTLSGAWSSAQYTATASNGKSVSSGYVYISGAASNAYFSTGTNLVVAAHIVAGGSVIRANDTTVYDIGSLLETNTTLTASEWNNNQSTVTAKVNGSTVGALTVTAPTTTQRTATSAGSVALTSSDTGSAVSKTVTVTYDNGTTTPSVPVTIDASEVYAAGQVSKNISSLSSITLTSSDIGSAVIKSVTITRWDQSTVSRNVTINASAVYSAGRNSVTVSSNDIVITEGPSYQSADKTLYVEIEAYASNGESGTKQFYLDAEDAYNAGWNAALDACTGHTCYTGTVKQLYDDSLDVYVNAISPYQTRYYYELPARKS